MELKVQRRGQSEDRLLLSSAHSARNGISREQLPFRVHPFSGSVAQCQNDTYETLKLFRVRERKFDRAADIQSTHDMSPSVEKTYAPRWGLSTSDRRLPIFPQGFNAQSAAR